MNHQPRDVVFEPLASILRRADLMSTLELQDTPTSETPLKSMEIEVIIKTDENGDIFAYVNEIPGLYTQGKTVDETIENFVDAFKELYLSYLEHDEVFPLPHDAKGVLFKFRVEEI